MHGSGGFHVWTSMYGYRLWALGEDRTSVVGIEGVSACWHGLVAINEHWGHWQDCSLRRMECRVGYGQRYMACYE